MSRILIISSALILLFVTVTFAEIKTFDVSVEEPVSRNQSQEAVEAFALQKAKRLAVEQAGTYLSSMTVVEQGKLSKAEVTALASGIVRTKLVRSDAVVINGQIMVQVTARVLVDTEVLEKQVDGLLKDRFLLKELEAKDIQMRALEDKLSRIQGAEVKRLQELNAQAVAMEIEREKRRLSIEEQRLKAEGDMAKAELAMLQEEQKRADRFEQIRKEQEDARQKDLYAIAREKDRLRKAKLENEANAAELARSAELARARWVIIDDRLSAEQAKLEAENIRSEIDRLTQKLDRQHERAKENLKTAYQKQIEATKRKMQAEPTAKDLFETSEEYNLRIAAHKRKVEQAYKEDAKKIGEFKFEERFKLADLKAQSLEIKLTILKPFVERLGQLQKQVFLLPKGKVTVQLQAPEADKSRFPLALGFDGKIYESYWTYQDRGKARLFYQTRSHLMAEPLFKLEPRDDNNVDFVFVGAKLIHPGTKEKRDLLVLSPRLFGEIGELNEISTHLIAERYYADRIKWKIIGSDGYYIAYQNGIVEDTKNGVEWYVGPDQNTSWNNAKMWVTGLAIDGGGWRMPSRMELNRLYEQGNGSLNISPLLKTTGWWVWSGERDGPSSDYAWRHNFFRWRDEDKALINYSNRSRAFAVRSQK